jgi:hypothetical protein
MRPDSHTVEQKDCDKMEAGQRHETFLSCQEPVAIAGNSASISIGISKSDDDLSSLAFGGTQEVLHQMT